MRVTYIQGLLDIKKERRVTTLINNVGLKEYLIWCSTNVKGKHYMGFD
jgi:short-subunit dehydrogenase